VSQSFVVQAKSHHIRDTRQPDHVLDSATTKLWGSTLFLIEKNDVCGGLVTSFIRNGYLFDAGVRALENAGMVKPMLEDLEIDVHLYPSEVSVGVEDKIMHVETEDSVNDYETLLKELYPESQGDVARVIEVIKKYYEYMKVLFGSDSPFFKDEKRDTRYYFTTFFAWIVRFIATGIAVFKMRIPVEDFLGDLIQNRSLNDIISQHFFKGTPAFFAMSYFSLYTDYFYPRGGVGKVPELLEEKLLELGAEVLKNTDITSVDVGRKLLTDQNGRSYEYSKLIWAADLKQLYRITDADGLPARRRPQVLKEKERVLAGKGAESVFTVFMGVNQPPERFSQISGPHFFYTPSRSGLGSLQRTDLKSMLENWRSVSKDEVYAWMHRFCELNTYEISIPALSDPEAAPAGKTGLIASFLLEYELVRRIEDDGWYDEFEAALENKIIDVLDASIYPDLGKTLEFQFSAGPLTIERKVRSSDGAFVGWSFEQPIPIDSSMLDMKNSVRTAIPDVFKVGQWAASPAGIPTCILTAKLAADIVYKGR
jgi:phytoene dehydrogenase-like protein